MIAKAIGPQNTVGAIGMRPSTVETAVSMIGPKPGERRLDHRGPNVASLRPLGLDLIDEDHSVARDHADQREDPQDRHESERPVGEEEREHDADQSERHGRHHQRDAPETVQLRHQKQEHQKQAAGRSANTEACDCALSSTVPPVAMW